MKNAAGIVPKTRTVLLDDHKSCGWEIHKIEIPRANDYSCGESTLDDNGEQPADTDEDDNEKGQQWK